jgi:SAM-dependent methyltransferase
MPKLSQKVGPMAKKPVRKVVVEQASIYDFPKYYELAFGSDWSSEVRFLREVFARHASGKVKRVLEPACGTGRILYQLCKAGIRVDGFDLNQVSLDYCQKRTEKRGLASRVWNADMADFETDVRYDSAFIMINSFRHLMDEQSALNHLRCMARAVRAGGVYVVGLYLCPTKAKLSQNERWSARKGNLVVNSDVRYLRSSPKKRTVTYSMHFDVYTPTMHRAFEHLLTLRSYTLDQFRSLIERCPEWEIQAFYDFQYDIDQPIQPDSKTEDAVVVLKRRV